MRILVIFCPFISLVIARFDGQTKTKLKFRADQIITASRAAWLMSPFKRTKARQRFSITKRNSKPFVHACTRFHHHAVLSHTFTVSKACSNFQFAIACDFGKTREKLLLHKIKEKKRNERLAGSAEDWNDDRRRGIRWRDSDRCRYSRLYWCVMLIDCVTCVCVCLIKLVCFWSLVICEIFSCAVFYFISVVFVSKRMDMNQRVVNVSIVQSRDSVNEQRAPYTSRDEFAH